MSDVPGVPTGARPSVAKDPWLLQRGHGGQAAGRPRDHGGGRSEMACR